MKYQYIYDDKKNTKLRLERGICFEDAITAISNGDLLDIIPHHNKRKYPNQMILIINIDNYAYLIPYVEEDNVLALKTVFPSRKFTKLYLGGNK